MTLVNILLLVNFLIVGFSQGQKQCDCGDIYEPECGKDGVTYNNKCERKCQSVPKAADGPCPEGNQVGKKSGQGGSDSSKPAEQGGRRMKPIQEDDDIAKPTEQGGRRMKPVQEDSGSSKPVAQGGRRMKLEKNIDNSPEEVMQGRSMNDDCNMSCKRIEMEYFGRCGGGGGATNPPDKNCGCKKKYKPECGKDGKTYSNKCLRECDGAERFHGGECTYTEAYRAEVFKDPKYCNCTKEHQPLCGVDGMTYNNECYMRCAKVKLKQHGPCGESPNNCGCSKIYKPECAYDRRTYTNKCLRECKGAEIKHDGPCNEESARSGGADIRYCLCERWHNPRCGENGLTYSSECVMNCRGASRMVHYGPCSDEEATSLANKKCNCGTEFEPVCGMNKRTYYNKCFAECKDMKINHGGHCPNYG